MYKPNSLRSALEAADEDLKRNPDRMRVFIDEGSVRATAATSLSFEYGYILNVVVLDYARHADHLIAPTLAWLSVHQPEMLQNPDLMRDGFTFEADILNNKAVDLSLKLRLTERVAVSVGAGGALVCQHLDEPPVDPHAGVSWE
ncbi:MAG: phage tail protein [Moraxellaceae bacterium]|nr:phage tail protein [Moraxellaceae bacterium]